MSVLSLNAAEPVNGYSLVHLLREGMTLATRSERNAALRFMALILVAGVVDLLALSVVMPFVALLIDPTVLDRIPFMRDVNAAVGRPSPDVLIPVAAVLCLGLATASTLFSFLLDRAVSRFVARCKERLGRQVIGEIIRAPLMWHLGQNSSVMAHIVQRDTITWAQELVLKALGVVRDLVMVALPALLVLITTPISGILAVIAIGVLVAYLLRMARPRIERLTLLKNAGSEGAQLFATQALAGARDVKLSGREDSFVEMFGRAFGKIAYAQAMIRNWNQLPTTVIILAGQIALFVLAFALWLVKTDPALLAAQLALLVMVTSRVLPAANRLASAVTTFYTSAHAVRNIIALRNDLIAAHAAGRSFEAGTDIIRPWRKLEARAISFEYPVSSVTALDGVSFTIEAGRSYGIVGGSGSGKSTLVDLIAGLLPPTRGAICIDNQPLDGLSKQSWRKGVGYVPQSPFLSDDTLRANIAFGVRTPDIDDARVVQAVAVAGLDDVIAGLEHGLDTPLGDRGTRLSGGQRQRVAIARALYDDIDLLILDEATSALDTVTERIVQRALETLKGRITTVTIAHRLSTVRAADCIFVLDSGRLTAAGDWNELLATSPVFRKLIEADRSELAA